MDINSDNQGWFLYINYIHEYPLIIHELSINIP